MTQWILMFLVNFVVVFLKAYQTQVIISGTYLVAFFISLLMGAAILTNTMFVIDYGWIVLIPLSLGGSCGVVCSMYIYRKRNGKR